jgi:hypothetical protein
MEEIHPRPSAPPVDSPKEAAPPGHAAAASQVNGTPDGHQRTQEPPHGDAAHDDRSGLDRAEEIVDHLAEKASAVTAAGGRRVLWFMSRAREVAEDFWADVQDFRHGKKP